MSTSNRYQLYIDSVIKLAQTIVVKSADIAEVQNQYIALEYGPSAVGAGPTQWKYYMNLAGQYHPTDTNMTVVSMDTLETIDFTVQNLKIHTNTNKGYQFGTKAYQELVQRYPNQETLILGILYPLDLQTAVSAPDGAILGYPPGLVEPQEDSLIPNLQIWVNNFRYRWFNPAYLLTDNLYLASHLGIMYVLMVQAILAIRLSAAKTREAHSYHYSQYLSSHGFLDMYLSNMTLKQSLWFYRNIKYIEHHPGKQTTYDVLVEQALTQRQIPLASYKFKADTSTLPDQYYPGVVFEKRAENRMYAQDSVQFIDLDGLLYKQDALARLNPSEHTFNIPQIMTSFQNSTSSTKMTKVLESTMVDMTNSEPHSFTDILLNEWLYRASIGQYTGYVGVDNPSNGDRIVLNTGEAWLLMLYAYHKSNGIELDEIPPLIAQRVLQSPRRPMSAIRAYVDRKYMDDSTLADMYGGSPVYQKAVSADAHWYGCRDIYTWEQKWRTYYSNRYNHHAHGQIKNALAGMFANVRLQINTGSTTYDQFFTARTLDFTNMTTDNWISLYTSLVQEGTGSVNHQTPSVRDIQASMVKLMSQLSSYSIQLLAEINDTGIKKLDMSPIQLGDQIVHVDQSVVWEPIVQAVQHWSVKLFYRIQANFSKIQRTTPLTIKLNPLKLKWPMPKLLHLNKIPETFTYQLTFNTVAPRFTGLVKMAGLPMIPGEAEWWALSDEQKRDTIDMYNTNYWNEWHPKPAATRTVTLNSSTPVDQRLRVDPATYDADFTSLAGLFQYQYLNLFRIGAGSDDFRAISDQIVATVRGTCAIDLHVDDDQTEWGIANMHYEHYALPSAQLPDANAAKYRNVVVIRIPSECKWGTGIIYLHYNPR